MEGTVRVRVRRAAILAATILTVAACGSDNAPDHDAVDQVKACISRGGDPKYTSYADSGNVAVYLGCVEASTVP